MKCMLDFLFFVDINLLAYSTLHGKFSFGKTREPTMKATGSEILI